jgi:hypothetical protein
LPKTSAERKKCVDSTRKGESKTEGGSRSRRKEGPKRRLKLEDWKKRH